MYLVTRSLAALARSVPPRRVSGCAALDRARTTGQAGSSESWRGIAERPLHTTPTAPIGSLS